MEEILIKANELGVLIKETDAYTVFEELNKEVEKDNGASLLLKKYNEIAETIQQKQGEGFTLEKFEQERFRDISAAVASNELLLKYLKARDVYIKLLMSIHNALSSTES
jgi:cell fate (sporulation/competence/biofilm development) regulator YlbF (YheA/YmcA/DUF963 family)